MRRVWQAGVLAVGMLVLMGRPVRAVDQKEIDLAIDRGVQALRSMQTPAGTWNHVQIGATALAGLTLLECGAKPDDPAVQAATKAVRAKAVSLTHTYSIALSILFLDRLDDPVDVPLIESLGVRLLAGQNAMGGWSYDCPGIDPATARWLMEEGKRRTELVGRRELPKGPPKGKRTVRDLSKETRALLTRLAAGGGVGGVPPAMNLMASDNSNTQFAIMGLWAARRHGLPVANALLGVEKRFRASQNADGGWGYMAPMGGMMMMGGMSTATMTCAGVLGLTVANGQAAALRGPKGRPRDISKDKVLQRGLAALGTAIDHPVAKRPKGAEVPRVADRAYYFLWSLERVAVALDLETIGKKDWYAWGAEILLANQGPGGIWSGAYGESGVDTCFALLFLKRANLTKDLTATLKGKLKDPGEAVLKGGVGAGGLRGKAVGLKPAVESTRGREPKPERRPGGKPVAKPGPAEWLPGTKRPKDLPAGRPAAPPAIEDAAVARLVDEVVAAPAARQGPLLERLRDAKGSENTEALATAIPRLRGEARDKAREALADRLGRMTADTLAEYLPDEDAEIRVAAALACRDKDKAEGKKIIPGLIRLLSDAESRVRGAAHQALKKLSGRDFGPEAGATRAERARAITAWEAWWVAAKRK